MLLGNFVPQTPYSVSVFSKIKSFSFHSFDIDSYMNMSMLFLGPRFKIWMLASNMHQKGLNYYFICQKASASGGLRPPDPYYFFQRNKTFSRHQIFNIDFSWMWAIEHGLEPCILSFISNVCLKYAPKCMVSRLNFQKFSGEGLTEPPPQTPPPVFSRALPSVRASPSILGRFAPSIRASPSTFDWGSWFGPPKVNSWIRQCAKEITALPQTL